MSTYRYKYFLEILYNGLHKRVVYHSMIWLFWLLFFFIGKKINTPALADFIVLRSALIHTLILSVGVYFNYNYLIPYFLKNNHKLIYIILLIGTAIVLAPINSFLSFINLHDYPHHQQQVYEGQFSVAWLIVFLLGISTILKIVSDWFRQQKIQQDLTHQNLQSELRFLRSQIDPHFLFNTLNSLYALTLKKSDIAPELVLRLSGIMRYMLYECNEKTVPLEKEIDYIRNYLELERLRHGDKASIHFDIIGDPEGYSISPLLFTPFLENSFKHGLNNSIDSKFVEVTLKIEQKGILFEIKNSKPLAPILKEHGGIGLANIYRRLDILYPNNYELVIKEEATTYNVYLKIQPILYQSSTNKIKEYEQN